MNSVGSPLSTTTEPTCLFGTVHPSFASSASARRAVFSPTLAATDSSIDPGSTAPGSKTPRRMASLRHRASFAARSFPPAFQRPASSSPLSASAIFSDSSFFIARTLYQNQSPKSRLISSQFPGCAQGTIASSLAISFASRVVKEVTRRPRHNAANLPR